MSDMILARALGGIDDRFLLEAMEEEVCETGKQSGSGAGRRILLIAAVVCCFLLLSAFAYRIFSPLNGDALTLSGTYLGEGIVSVQVENRSSRDLRFQPQVKLVKWLGEEEIPRLGGAPVFTNEEIPAGTTQVMTVDLSPVYDMEALEASHPWQWYYLILTNRDFFFGHEWKCSVNFGSWEPDPSPTEGKNYTLDPNVLANIEEELRPYFEDDYVGIFAANPMNYSYMQQAQEYLLRCGRRIVPLIDGGIIGMPLPDGVIFDASVPPEKQYALAGGTSSVHDAFGKLVGATQSEKVDIIQVYLPAYEGSTDQSWTMELLYFASFERAQIQSGEDCAFIHGQVVSFGELEPYKVYEDETVVTYHVTHLFYTDLRAYAENVYAVEIACGNSNVYFDEEVYARIGNIAAWYAENLRIVSLTEYIEDICPRCQLSGGAFTEQGLSGLIESNKPIERVIVTVAAEEGEELLRLETVPEDPYRYQLDAADDVPSFIRTLPDGVYVLDVSVELDSDFMSFMSLWTQMFTAGEASLPGVP